MSSFVASPPAGLESASRDAILARPLQHNRLWADVTPLKQDDGESQGCTPVVPINYPAHYSDVMDIFRAVVASGELSPRVLLLSEAVIDCNSANYSAWHLRRQCLERLQSDLRAELEWVATVALDTPKNYQLWHHRRCLLERMDERGAATAHEELQLTADVLDMDSKNYHAWSHRQWCLNFFSRPSAAAGASAGGAPALDVFGLELRYVAELLDADVRNNSAWNQRFFVRTRAPQFVDATAAATTDSTAQGSADSTPRAHPMSAAVLHEELAFTAVKLLLAPHNESPWNFLEGLLRQPRFDAEHRKEMLHLIAALPPGRPGASEEQPPLPNDASEEELVARAAALPNRFAQSLLVELWQLQSPASAASASASSAAPASAAAPSSSSFPAPRLDLARAACLRLGAELDPLRAKYWSWRAGQIDAALAAAGRGAQS